MRYKLKEEYFIRNKMSVDFCKKYQGKSFESNGYCFGGPFIALIVEGEKTPYSVFPLKDLEVSFDDD